MSDAIARPVPAEGGLSAKAPDSDWIPESTEAAETVVQQWTQRKIDALLRERGLDDEVETTRRFVVETVPEYADRFLLELLQNAHDALPQKGGGRICIEFNCDAASHGELLVANTGTPFRYKDFRSLCRMAQSEKRPGEGIGHKGVGFKSVLQVAPQPEVYSAALGGSSETFRGFCFTFPDQAQYDRLFAGADKDVPQMTPYSLPVVLPADRQPTSVRRLAAEGYSTVVRLPLGEHATEAAQRAIRDIVSSTAPVLLFLRRIGELIVCVDRDGSRTEQRLSRTPKEIAKGNLACVEDVDLAEAGRFLVARGYADEEEFKDAISADVAERLASDRWLEWNGRPEVSVAVSVERRKDDRLYCYLPLDVSAHSPVAGHVNGPFAIGLARKSLIIGSRINEVLLNAAADVSVDAAIELKSQPGFRAQMVDFVAWQREGNRIVDAFIRREEIPAKFPILPVLGPSEWASFEDANCWSPDGTTQLTAPVVAELVDDVLVDPIVGRDRMSDVTNFRESILGLPAEPTPDRLARWVEAVAIRLHKSEKGDSPPSGAWMELYDDLPRVFAGTMGRALAGKRILLGEAKALLEACSDADALGATKARREVFFARTALDDPDGDATDDGAVPGSLRPFIGRVNPDLNWFVPGEVGRRNRPGRVFLEQHDLVRIPRVLDLLRLIERVLKRSRSSQIRRDALIFVYRLTRPGPRRPDLRTLGLQRMGLHVPAGGNWIPSQRGLFSRGWTESGALLSDFVDSAGSVSTEVESLKERLLDSSESWIPRGMDLEGWIELLRHCGVSDGLRPVASSLSAAASATQGWWWQDKERIADGYGINAADRLVWFPALEFGSWPRSPYAAYVSQGAPVRIPGQSEFESFSEKAKVAFAKLVLSGLREWDDSVFSFVVERRHRSADAQRIPTPAKAFLASARWLRVRRPGGNGEEDWATPAEAWLLQPAESEPFFAPILDRNFRATIEGSERAYRRVLELGAHSWSEPEHAIAKLRLLGRLLHDGQVLPGLVAQVRNATEETWRIVVESKAPSQLGDLRDLFLVVTRSDQLDTIAASAQEPFFIMGSTDRMLELVLVSIGKPVLIAKGDIGQMVWSALRDSGALGARLISPSDLVVEIDGQPAGELIDRAESLLSGKRKWLSDLLALTLELKPTAFRPPTIAFIQGALRRLFDIRLINGNNVALRLEGNRLEVPTHSQGVVPTDIDGTPAIAWVPSGGQLTWRDLLRLAPAIAELTRVPGIRDSVENILHRLGDGAAFVEEPTDDDFAQAFGVPLVRIQELRRAHRGLVSQLLYTLVPLIAAIIGIDESTILRSQATEIIDSEQGLKDALESLRDRLPSEISLERLLSVAAEASLLDARDQLGIAFGTMNRALAELGPPYSPVTDPDQHASVMSIFLANNRGVIADSLRVGVIRNGADAPGVLERYAAAIRQLDDAIKRARAPETTDLLAPDPSWLLDYAEPPEHLLIERVTRWLSSHGGASSMMEGTGLEPVESLRAANGQRLSVFLARAALVVGAWLDRHGTSATPDWLSNPSGFITELVTKGRLDFHLLSDDDVIAILAATQAWPPEMMRTIDLAELHLTEEDLRDRKSEDDLHRVVESRAKRGVEVAGRIITLDPETIAESVAYLLSTIEPSSLDVSPSETALGAAPELGGKRKPGGPGGGRDTVAKGRVPKEKLETIGLIGELVAWAWLTRHFGEEKVLWRSTNRAFKFQDGDPGDDNCGFDFEVLHGRSRLYYEIKASTGDPREFELSEAEVRFAMSKAGKGTTYRVLYIGNVNSPRTRVIMPLPNPLATRSRKQYRALESGIKYAFIVTGRAAGESDSD